MTPARLKALGAAVLLALSLLLLARKAGVVAAAGREELCAAGSDVFVDGGEALLRGVPRADVSWAMPAGSALGALACGGTRAAAAAWRVGALAAGALLVFFLGGLVHSAAGGAAALGLYALVLSPEWFLSERWPSVVLAAAAACAAAWRARRPGPARSAALAAVLGANLCAISTLFLFGPLLAAWDWAARRRERSARAGAAAAILALGPFLLLAPWVFMNFRVHGRLVPFEDGRADSNVIAGALGLVVAPAGDAAALADLSGKSPLVWAAGEVLRHPLRFAAAFAARLAFVASLHPFLLAAGVLGAWAGRRRAGVRALALLCAYLAAVPCLMPVKESYFFPLWPPLAALAASLCVRPLSARARPWGARAAAVGLGTLLAGAAAVALFGLTLAAAYPARAARPDALDEELSRHPGDARLWALRGESRLSAGRAAEAEADFRRAFALDPQRAYAVDRAWAAAAAGGRDRPPADPPGPWSAADARADVLRTLALLRAGRREEAAAAWRAARAALARRPGSSAPIDAHDLSEAARRVLGPFPPDQRARFLAGLARLGASAPDALDDGVVEELWRALVSDAEARGDLDGARLIAAALARGADAGLRAEARSRLAGLDAMAADRRRPRAGP